MVEAMGWKLQLNLPVDVYPPAPKSKQLVREPVGDALLREAGVQPAAKRGSESRTYSSESET